MILLEFVFHIFEYLFCEKGGFMVIDCHYHLEERVLTRGELLAEMDRAGIDKVALMGSMIPPFHEPPRFLLRLLQVFLEQHFLRKLGKIFVSDFTPQGDIKILGKPYPITADPSNSKVFDALREHPDRFLGWVFVNPRGQYDPVTELEKYQNEPGFIGVKAHSFWHHFSPVELAPVAEKLVQMDKPLLIHVGFEEEGNFDALLQKVPDLKLILAHTGFPEYGDTWKAVKDKKNVFFDLSQTSYVSGKATIESVAYLGPERIFYGTDGPYGFHDKSGKYDYGFIKRRIERVFPDEGLRRRLLGENFAEITGIR
jgi:predicted TIM-barrel fold metal-dependent hydrolase